MYKLQVDDFIVKKQLMQAYYLSDLSMQWSALTFPEEDTSMRGYHSHHALLNPQSQSVSLIISPVISGLHVDIIS